MEETGKLFGWAFGDPAQANDQTYLDGLRASALENARQDADARGFEVLSGTEVYAVVDPSEALVDAGTAPGGLIMRCTVTVAGDGAGNISAEGPMNG